MPSTALRLAVVRDGKTPIHLMHQIAVGEHGTLGTLDVPEVYMSAARLPRVWSNL